MAIRRIGLLTGGGDCPGLNAVIRAVVKDAHAHGIEVLGIRDGYLGLIEDRTLPLGPDDVAGILTHGGTILGSSNKSNPSRFAVGTDDVGKPVFEDVSQRCMDHLDKHKVDALAVVGGDGTMASAARFAKAGVNVIGIPKTIDNDLHGTELTFGFLTAVSIATDALDRVRTTAASHHRALVVEVMGRNAGWIALHAGIASGSDVILIPEIPFSFESVVNNVMARRAKGRTFSIVCVSEGARPSDGEQTVARLDPTSPDPVRLGGIAKVIADRIESMTGVESRFVVLGHVQRGGTPVAADRVLATQFGHHAMTLLKSGARNRLVAMAGMKLTDVDLEIAAKGQRLVPVAGTQAGEHPLIIAARAIGASFGDD